MQHNTFLRSSLALLLGAAAATSLVACGSDTKNTATTAPVAVTDLPDAGGTATDGSTGGTGDPIGSSTGGTAAAGDLSVLSGLWTGACATDAYLMEGHPFMVVYDLQPQDGNLNMTAQLTIFDLNDTGCDGTPLGSVAEQGVLQVNGQASIEGLPATIGMIADGTNCGQDDALCDLALGLFQDEQRFAFGIDANGQLLVSEPAAGDNGHGVPNAWQHDTMIVKG